MSGASRRLRRPYAASTALRFRIGSSRWVGAKCSPAIATSTPRTQRSDVVAVAVPGIATHHPRSPSPPPDPAPSPARTRSRRPADPGDAPRMRSPVALRQFLRDPVERQQAFITLIARGNTRRTVPCRTQAPQLATITPLGARVMTASALAPSCTSETPSSVSKRTDLAISRPFPASRGIYGRRNR